MSDPPSPDYRSLMIAALILAIGGWFGVFMTMQFTLPTAGPRWMFFFLSTIAVTGTALPFLWLLHRRFGRGEPTSSATLLRRALWVGFYTALCLWLQINRSLTLSLALLLAIGLSAVEWVLQLLESSRWRPSR